MMASSGEEFENSDAYLNDLPIIPISLTPSPQRNEARQADELENVDSATTIPKRKRKSRRVAHIDPMAKEEKLGKRINLSLRKPSYIHRPRSNKLRPQHRGILRKLLHKLVNQHNWVEASGVLSVYLRATIEETSPFENQFKFSVFLRLLKHVENGNIKPRRINSIYDVWMMKNGRMKDEPIEKRYAVDLDLILFFMMQGNIEDAYKAATMWQEKEIYDHPLSNMLMGLIFYELWYSSVPKEFQWRDSDQSNSPRTLFMEQDTSCLYTLEGYDALLLPLYISDHESFENFILMRDKLLDNNYRNAVRHLQIALDSTPSALAALLPLIQLLLIGDQVDEALNVLEKQCCTSFSALPFRLKAILMERFKSNDSLLLANCFEETLKKDPTCCESLAKLVKLHEDDDGNCSVDTLVEIIASHLDAVNAEHYTWKQFAYCFSRLFNDGQNCGSSCLNDDREYKQPNSSFLRSTPKVLTKNFWEVRCRWWLNRHFSPEILRSEIEAGELQILTYKAACASYMYGKKFHYAVEACSHLEKNDLGLLRILNGHRQNSYGFYK